MRSARILLAAVMISLLLVTFISGAAFGQQPKTVRLYGEATKLATEAQNTKAKRVQGDIFQDAIKKYRQVAKEGSGRPEAAQSLLAVGKILTGVPIQSTPEDGVKRVYKSTVPSRYLLLFPSEGTLQNDYTARETFQELIRKFDKPKSKLVSDYGSEDAEKIATAVAQAEVYSKVLADRVSVTNRGKALYKIMDALVAVTGRIPWFSYWFAIILLTVIVKIMITPLTKAQFKSMKEMQRLQPLIKQLQEKHKGDQRELGAQTMALYKEHGVNPVAGCLPILIQMPILILVYTAIRYYEFQFANGTFLWIGWNPLEHIWSFNLTPGAKPIWVTAANLAQPDMILLVLYTISMVVSQRLSAVDPTQAEQQKMLSIMMPVMFFFLIGYLPSAFVLYWLTFNVLQTWQQYHIIHGAQPVGAPPEEPAASATARVRRSSGRRRRRR